MTLKGRMLMAAISARRITKDADLSPRGVGNEDIARLATARMTTTLDLPLEAVEGPVEDSRQLQPGDAAVDA